MGLLDVNLNDAEELKRLPDNTEVQLQITRAEVTPNRSDPSRSNLALTLEDPSDPLVDDIRVWLPIPTPDQKDDDPKRYTKSVHRFSEFCKAFDFDPADTEVEELVGKTGWAIVGEGEDLNGNANNSVRRFVASKG